LKRISRREFIIASATVALFVSSGVYYDEITSIFDEESIDGDFLHGVASGDPQPDAVILWTRITPLGKSEKLKLSLEIAKDESFTELFRVEERLYATKEHDFTLKVDLQNLSPNTSYYYRFKYGEKYSPIGHTKTLPIGDISQVRLVVFSCSDYQKGYFNVYDLASKMDGFDAVLHLGDYIYESGANSSFTPTPASIRQLPPHNSKTLYTLAAYRDRYALHRSDKSLQSLHAKAPFIAVWDDHEVANDAYSNGAANHDDTIVSYETRKLEAIRAYLEWMPIRPHRVHPTRIYRHFEFGNLVNLSMLDSRHEAREKQMSFNKANLSSHSTLHQELDEERALLGEEQESWLRDRLSNSNALWQVVAQQVLMARLHVPLELMPYIMKLGQKNEQEFYMQAGVKLHDLYRLKQKSFKESLSEDEKLRLKAVPYSLDSWDGYSRCRERIYQSMIECGKNIVVLSGDSHNAWANELTILNDGEALPVGVEFATPSATSDGMEAYAKLHDNNRAQMLEKAAITLVDDLKYLNANNRGFMVVTFNHDEVRSEWFFVDTVKNKEYKMTTNMPKYSKHCKSQQNRK